MTSLKVIDILHSPCALTTQSECPFFHKIAIDYGILKKRLKKGLQISFSYFLWGFKTKKSEKRLKS